MQPSSPRAGAGGPQLSPPPAAAAAPQRKSELERGEVVEVGATPLIRSDKHGDLVRFAYRLVKKAAREERHTFLVGDRVEFRRDPLSGGGEDSRAKAMQVRLLRSAAPSGSTAGCAAGSTAAPHSSAAASGATARHSSVAGPPAAAGRSTAAAPRAAAAAASSLPPPFPPPPWPPPPPAPQLAVAACWTGQLLPAAAPAPEVPEGLDASVQRAPVVPVAQLAEPAPRLPAAAAAAPARTPAQPPAAGSGIAGSLRRSNSALSLATVQRAGSPAAAPRTPGARRDWWDDCSAPASVPSGSWMPWETPALFNRST
eukprot:TRINITY_DN47360_c0_g1_i1.p2 TRINITY_DN47360_c0_g1~~TRINITY_DN47360_c0_g1_i1.p2  ORF type:complete len:313 (+),score=21.43 TRINITY_DN47360_c0_g1_i1:82-1020(+)